MPEYLYPGVYVEEVDTGNKPIEGVSTSTVGFLGVAERGPVKPTLVTSYNEFARLFGSYFSEPDGTQRYLAYGGEGFFQNGRKRCFVMRVVLKDAATPARAATLAVGGMTIDAIGPGLAGNRVVIKIEPGTQKKDTNDFFRLTVMYWSPVINVPGLGGVAGTLVDPTDPTKRTDDNRREPTILEVYDNLTANARASNFYLRQVTD